MNFQVWKGHVALLFSSAACLLASARAPAAQYRVPSEFSTIQAAVDACLDGDTVLVAPGIYTGVGNREILFHGVDLTLASEAGPLSTVIDCQGSGRGFDFRAQESSLARLEGFTIQNGRATAPTFPGGFAGGISCRGLSNPTIQNCVVVDCHAGAGGALGCSDASPIVEDCVFSGGLADQLGGCASLINFSEPIFRRCRFSGGAATNGGILNLDHASPIFIECTIAAGNATALGGGMRLRQESRPEFVRSIVWGSCAASGGNLYLEDPASAISFECCDVDTSGAVAAPEQLIWSAVNFHQDPGFCAPLPCAQAPSSGGLFTLAAGSPCLPDGNDCAVLVGALDQGCFTPAGVDPTPGIRVGSWGRIKRVLAANSRSSKK